MLILSHLVEAGEMRRRLRPIALLLLMVFAFLALKNLLPNSLTAAESCFEFAHIHHNSQQECHAGQALFAISTLPESVFEFVNILPALCFQAVLSIDPHFISPDLNPPRRPPRV